MISRNTVQQSHLETCCLLLYRPSLNYFSLTITLFRYSTQGNKSAREGPSLPERGNLILKNDFKFFFLATLTFLYPYPHFEWGSRFANTKQKSNSQETEYDASPVKKVDGGLDHLHVAGNGVKLLKGEVGHLTHCHHWSAQRLLLTLCCLNRD
jgi:hypothetical protein